MFKRFVKYFFPLTFTAFLIVSCGDTLESVTAENPFYQAEFEEAMKDANEFQKAILADGVITQDEYYETQDKYSMCLEEKGYELIPNRTTGGYRVGYDSSDPVALQADFDCARETVWPIESMYHEISSNPENEDFNDVIARCLVRHDLVPKDFSGDDFDQLFKNLGVQQTINEGDPIQGGIVTLPEESKFVPSPVLPGGLPLGDPKVQPCLVNPQE